MKNPGNITAVDVGHQITIAVFTETKLYSNEATVTTEYIQQAGVVLTEANTRFYSLTTTKYISVTLLNSGTADTKITQVYLGTAAANVVDITSTVTWNPTTKIVRANGGSINATWSYSWVSGQRYYFKFITEAGQSVPFDRLAP